MKSLVLFLGILMTTHLQAQKIWMWCEFSNREEVATSLSLLLKNNIGVIRAVRPLSSEFSQDLAIIEMLLKNGIKVKPWILLPEKDGYWFSAFNPEKSILAVNEWLKLSHEAGIYLNDLVLDFEPPVDRLRQLRVYLGPLKIKSAKKLMAKNLTKAEYIAARDTFQKAFDRWKEDEPEMKIHIVTTPLVLLDHRKDKVEQFLGLPIRGLKVDGLSFMVCRSEFMKFFPKVDSSFTGFFTHKAIKKITKNYNMPKDKLSIDLGIFGSFDFPEKTEGIAFSQLTSEMNQVFGQGLKELHLYSLDNFLRDNKLNLLAETLKNFKISCEIKLKAKDRTKWGLMRFVRFLFIPNSRH